MCQGNGTLYVGSSIGYWMNMVHPLYKFDHGFASASNCIKSGKCTNAVSFSAVKDIKGYADREAHYLEYLDLLKVTENMVDTEYMGYQQWLKCVPCSMDNGNSDCQDDNGNWLPGVSSGCWAAGDAICDVEKPSWAE